MNVCAKFHDCSFGWSVSNHCPKTEFFFIIFRSTSKGSDLSILENILMWKCSSECWLSTSTKLWAIAAWEVLQKRPQETKIFQKKKTPPPINDQIYTYSRPTLEKLKAPCCSPIWVDSFCDRQNWASWWSLPSKRRRRKPIFWPHTNPVNTIKNQSP